MRRTWVWMVVALVLLSSGQVALWWGKSPVMAVLLGVAVLLEGVGVLTVAEMAVRRSRRLAAHRRAARELVAELERKPLWVHLGQPIPEPDPADPDSPYLRGGGPGWG